MISTLQDNAIVLSERVQRAALRVDRDPEEIQIVAVSKSFPRAAITAAYDAGFRAFGENRVQEIRDKYAEPYPADIEIHMIGSLQTNKIAQILPYMSVLQTLDRVTLVSALQSHLEKTDRHLNVLIQVNVSGELQKSGVSLNEARTLLDEVLQAPRLRPIGLMTMAPFGAHEQVLRDVFSTLRILRNDLQQATGAALPQLSMGMSDDFEIAIEEGATIIRPGRSLFGDRN